LPTEDKERLSLHYNHRKTSLRSINSQVISKTYGVAAEELYSDSFEAS